MKTLSRRTILRGMGAAVALPVLDIMLDSHGEALAGGSALPLRFATFLFGNGVILNRWTPAAQGASWALTDELAPLSPVKAYCSILSGFRNMIPPITHHEGMAGMFSGHPYVQTGGLESKSGGPTIDQVVADAIAGNTPFKSLEVGVSKRVSKNEGNTMQFLSHRGPDEPMPPEYSPRALFARLFDTQIPDDGSRARRVAVLDAVRDDAKRLRGILGTTDRQRLDAHLEAVHRLQMQIDVTKVCAPPVEPTEENVDAGGEEPMDAVAELMTDLLVHAWSCDLNRVASYMLTGGVGFTVYSQLGQTQEQHFMSHMPETYGAQLHATIVWNMQRFSYLLQRLAATSEGTGNLLDRSLILLGSDCAQGWTHGAFDMPVVIAGKAGGALVHPGIHFRATGTQRNLSDALLTALKAVVPAATEIGSGVGYSQTPVTQILT